MSGDYEISVLTVPCDSLCLVQSCSSSRPCLSPLLPLEDILDEGLGLVLHSPDVTGDNRVNLMAESPADSLEDETDSAHKVRDHLLRRFIKNLCLNSLSGWIVVEWAWHPSLFCSWAFLEVFCGLCFCLGWVNIDSLLSDCRGVRGWLKSDGWLRALCHVI